MVKGIKTALTQCLGVKKGEQVLIVTDTNLRDLGEAIWQEVLRLEAEGVIMIMNPRDISGQEPPTMIAQAMTESQVVFLATSRSLTHTQARRGASQKGARIASLPGLTLEDAMRVLDADYQAIAQRSLTVAQVLTEGQKVKITSPQGTNLTFSIAGRKGGGDTGLYNIPGDYGNLPAGEASAGPVEGTAQGVLVVDGSMSGIGLLEEPITMEVRDGYVEGISGGKEAQKLKELLEPYGKDGRNIAELGVGTNDKAKVHGLIVEDEKTLGTIHIALGNNIIFGGKVEVPVHLDGILREPTLEIDGKILTQGGKLLLGEEIRR